MRLEMRLGKRRLPQEGTKFILDERFGTDWRGYCKLGVVLAVVAVAGLFVIFR